MTGYSGGALDKLQQTTQGLLAAVDDPNASQAVQIARSAIENGQAVKTLGALL